MRTPVILPFGVEFENNTGGFFSFPPFGSIEKFLSVLHFFSDFLYLIGHLISNTAG